MRGFLLCTGMTLRSVTPSRRHDLESMRVPRPDAGDHHLLRHQPSGQSSSPTSAEAPREIDASTVRHSPQLRSASAAYTASATKKTRCFAPCGGSAVAKFCLPAGTFGQNMKNRTLTQNSTTCKETRAEPWGVLRLTTYHTRSRFEKMHTDTELLSRRGQRPQPHESRPYSKKMCA